MPNYCNNLLEVSGDTTELKAFLSKGINEEYIEWSKSTDMVWRMSYYYSMPTELEGTDAPPIIASPEIIKKYGHDNWYSWRVANWGTKWDCTADSDSYNTDNETYFNCEFDSAWSPPCEWLAHVIKAYPNLEFKMYFMETGCWFCGVAYSRDGEMIREDGEPKRYSDSTGFEVDFDSEREVYIDSQGTEIDDEDVIEENPFERR